MLADDQVIGQVTVGDILPQPRLRRGSVGYSVLLDGSRWDGLLWERILGDWLIIPEWVRLYGVPGIRCVSGILPGVLPGRGTVGPPSG
ncbi:hypothetical protein ACIODX_36240 [Streptomyces sp. NPDC088190]|uniref:hypothetical protein n=1 Tax=unclassified Streptomyces TaxID=2593676 RepID=UPI002E7916EB|nr:hypothetical protein [Streptomyces sp. JV190]MEE1838930.1 hypothetical protein [Streptomyces sp. JV190]